MKVETQETPETQELILARSGEIERSTVPLPQSPRPQMTTILSDLEQLKEETNRSFESLVDWINEVVREGIAIKPVFAPLSLEDVTKIADYIVNDDKLLARLADKVVDNKIHDVLLDIFKRILDIERRLDKFNRAIMKDRI